MAGIGEEAVQRGSHPRALIVVDQHVLHPVQRLNNAHGGTVCPIEAAGRGILEMDLLIAEFDRLQPRVDEDLDAGRHGRGEAEIVGGGHAVDDRAGLVAARYGADDGAIIGNGWAAGQLVLRGRS